MNLKKLMQFNNPPGKIKNNMTTPHLKKSIGSSSSRLALLLIALVFACLGIRQSAQAGYIVTLQQVGPNVVATGSGAINLTGLTFSQSGSVNPAISARSHRSTCRGHLHGADFFQRRLLLRGQWTDEFRERWRQRLPAVAAATWSGYPRLLAAIPSLLSVPTGYVSGTVLSDSATYSGKTLASLGVTPGTYVWTWGTGANQNFTLQIPVPPPPPVTGPPVAITNPATLIASFSATLERLGESARIDHQRVFSIWNNEQLRTHYRPAKSHWEHLPKYQCEY